MSVYVGMPGSINDARMLRRSGTYMQVTQGTLLNVERGGIDNHTPYLIADKCYPVLPWLIPPYKKAAVNRTPTKKLLNRRINRARVVHCFLRLVLCYI
jgi:hypothetical protein